MKLESRSLTSAATDPWRITDKFSPFKYLTDVTLEPFWAMSSQIAGQSVSRWVAELQKNASRISKLVLETTVHEGFAFKSVPLSYLLPVKKLC